MFIFYKSFLEALLCLPKKSDRWDIIEAICNYSESGKIDKLPPRLMTNFLLIKPLIDNSNKKKRGNPNFEIGKQNPYSKEISKSRKRAQDVENLCEDRDKRLINIVNNHENLSTNSAEFQKILPSNICIKHEDLAINVGKNQDSMITNHCKNQDSLSTNRCKNIIDNSKIIGDKSADNFDNSFYDNDIEVDKKVDKKIEKDILPNIKKAYNNAKVDDFIVPKIEHIKEYITKNLLKVDADIFYNFYQSKGCKIGTSIMSDWKACLLGWDKKSDNVKKSQPKNIQERTYTEEHYNKLFTNLDDIDL